MWTRAATEFAELMCSRLSEMYKQRCEVQHVERISRLEFKVRYSIVHEGTMHRGMFVTLTENGQVDRYAVEEV